MNLPRSAKIFALLAGVIAVIVIVALVRAPRGTELTLTFAGFAKNTNASSPHPVATFVVSNASDRPIPFLGPGYALGDRPVSWPPENMPVNGPIPILAPHATRLTTLQMTDLKRLRAVVEYNRLWTFMDRVLIAGGQLGLPVSYSQVSVDVFCDVPTNAASRR